VPRKRKPGLPVGKAYERFSDIEKEIMQRLLECESPESICKGIGIDRKYFDSLVQAPVFEYEYNYLTRHLDRKLDKRLANLAQESLDVVRSIMRDATSPAYRLRAALEILDRSGHVKVEKRLQINADAESIIKHLNTLGTHPAKDTELVAEVVQAESSDPIENAVNQTLEAMSKEPDTND